MEENLELKNETIIENPSIIEDEKTFNRNKWFFTIPGLGRDMLYTLVSTYFLQYVQFGLTLTAVQFATLSLLIGILGRIWDGINDPMMGAIIEGSHIKWGKFKPWIFIGALADSILTIVLFNLRPSGWLYVAVICAVYLLWEAAFTMNDIGYWSMIPSLSRTKERRDKITTLTIFFAGLGTIAMTAMVTYLAPGNVLNAYTIFSIIAAVFVAGGQTITAIFVKEAKREDAEKTETDISLKKMVKTIFNNKQLLWMSLAMLCSSVTTALLLGLIYNLYYLEVGYNGNIIIVIIIYAVCNTFIQLIYPSLAKKFKRKQIQFVSFFFVIAGFLGLSLMGWSDIFPFHMVLLCICSVLIFAANTLFYTASVINLNNCVEYNEYITGERSEAVVTTMRPLIVKFGDAIKYLIVTLTLIFSGLYAITQNVSAIETQTNMFDKYAQEANNAKAYFNKYLELKALGNDKTEEEYNLVIDGTILDDCQFNGAYTDAVGKMYLVKLDNNEVLEVVQLKDAAIDFIEDGYKYSLKISVDVKNADGSVTNYNAADEIYAQNKDNYGTRISLRIACCILPALFMTACMIIQRYKFIVDEDYFDKIEAEIKEKKEKNLKDTEVQE